VDDFLEGELSEGEGESTGCSCASMMGESSDGEVTQYGDTESDSQGGGGSEGSKRSENSDDELSAEAESGVSSERSDDE
jgi:hypothetical protein